MSLSHNSERQLTTLRPVRVPITLLSSSVILSLS